MRARATNNQKKGRTEFKNYAVQIKEFITVNTPGSDGAERSQTGVVGTNLYTGEEETFFLTQPKNEEIAEKYASRPTLEKWSKPFKEFGVTKEVKPGGIFFFKNCIPFNAKDDPIGKHYKATWVDRLADNPADAQETFIRGSMVVEGFYDYKDKMDGDRPVTKEDGTVVKTAELKSGRAYKFETREDHHIVGASGKDVKAQLVEALAARNNPQMLVRFVNDGNQVCFDMFGSKSWEDKETRRDPADAAKLWAESIDDVMTALPDATQVNIVPVEAYMLSKEAIAKGTMAGAFKGLDYATSYFKDGMKMNNLQYCFGKTGPDEYSHIMNKLDCVEKGNKDNPRKDPTLLGELEYSPNYDANITIVENMNADDVAQAHQADTQEMTDESQAFEGAGMSQ